MPRDAMAEVPANNVGNWMADLIPLMPSTARDAGMASMLAERMGSDPSFLVSSPTAASIAGLAGSALMAPLGPAALLPWLAITAARRAEINGIRKRYQRMDDEGRLGKIPSTRSALTPYYNPSGNFELGRTMALLRMLGKDVEMGPTAEMSDPMSLVIPGYNIVGSPVVANVNAGSMRGKHASARREEEDDKRRRMVPLSDSRSNSTLPAFILAGLGGIGANIAAGNSMMRNIQHLKPTRGYKFHDQAGVLEAFKSIFANDNDIRRDVMRRVIGRDDGPRIVDIPGMQNAFHGRSTDGERVIGLGDGPFSSSTILAHEAGHAKIDRGNDIVKTLQDDFYDKAPLTMALSPLAAMGAGLMSGGTLRGAALGTLIGALGNSGFLVPEYMASRYAYKGMKNRDGSFAHGFDPKALGHAFATYAALGLVPSLLAGGAGGWMSGQRKKRRKEKEKQMDKEAAFAHDRRIAMLQVLARAAKMRSGGLYDAADNFVSKSGLFGLAHFKPAVSQWRNADEMAPQLIGNAKRLNFAKLLQQARQLPQPPKQQFRVDETGQLRFL